MHKIIRACICIILIHTITGTNTVTIVTGFACMYFAIIYVKLVRVSDVYVNFSL